MAEFTYTDDSGRESKFSIEDGEMQQQDMDFNDPNSPLGELGFNSFEELEQYITGMDDQKEVLTDDGVNHMDSINIEVEDEDSEDMDINNVDLNNSKMGVIKMEQYDIISESVDMLLESEADAKTAMVNNKIEVEEDVVTQDFSVDDECCNTFSIEKEAQYADEIISQIDDETIHKPLSDNSYVSFENDDMTEDDIKIAVSIVDGYLASESACPTKEEEDEEEEFMESCIQDYEHFTDKEESFTRRDILAEEDFEKSYHKRGGKEVPSTGDPKFDHIVLKLTGPKSRVPNKCIDKILDAKLTKMDADEAIKSNTEKLKEYATELLDESERGEKIVIDTTKAVATLAKESETARVNWNQFFNEICEQYEDLADTFREIKEKATTKSPRARSVNIKTVDLKEGVMSKLKHFITRIAKKFSKLENNLENIKRKYGIA